MLEVTLGFPVITTTIVSRCSSSAARSSSSPETGHVEIDRHDIELAAANQVAAPPPPARQGRQTVHLEHAGAALPKSPLIVDQQNLDARLDLGRDGERSRFPGSGKLGAPFGIAVGGLLIRSCAVVRRCRDSLLRYCHCAAKSVPIVRQSNR